MLELFHELATATQCWNPLQRWSQKNERILTHYERVSASERPAGSNSCFVFKFDASSKLCRAVDWHFSSTFVASTQNEKVTKLHDLKENLCWGAQLDSSLFFLNWADL